MTSTTSVLAPDLSKARATGVAWRNRRLSVPAALLAAALPLGGCGRHVSEAPPSVLLVTFDTLRADYVGCYGRVDAETPNLDRLAAEGTRFDEARSHVPLTLPSHTTILTGKLPPHTGVRGNGLFHLRAGVPTLAEALRGRGYATAAVVSSVVLDHAYGLDRGFDVYDDNQYVGDKRAFNYLERSGSQVVDAVARLLPRLGPPFFLWVHLYDPHRPWVAPPPFADRHPGQPYDAEIAFADAAFGEIRKAASARAGGRLIVLATADHGESLGYHGESRHGYTLHRGVLRVPMIVAGPGIPSGRRVTATVGLTDVAPTLAELAGASLAGADGVSLTPFWTGAKAGTTGHEPLWEETLHPLYESGWAPLRGIVTDGWHFVDAPRAELYSRGSDPDDQRDVAIANREVVGGLRSKLAEIGHTLGDTPEPEPELGDDPDDRERLAKLAALGYLGASPQRKHTGPRLDPKDGLPGFVAIEDAEGLLRQGRLREAYERVHPLVGTDPDNPRVWHAEGVILRALGRDADAQRALEHAVALDPRSELIRFAYADLLRARGDLAGARDQLERILIANPKMLEATLLLAASFDATGNSERAAAILKTACEAGVRDPDLLVRLGEHLERAGALEEASKRFAEVLEMRPDDPHGLLATGRSALRAGDASRAVEILSRCADGPMALDCRLELARALIAGPGDIVGARAVLVGAQRFVTTDGERLELGERLRALDGIEHAH